MGAQETRSELPRAFPLYAAASLLYTILQSLLYVLLHGLWLAPQCVAAAVRRRRGEPAPAPEAGLEFYEGKVNHTRLWPVFHTFTYPVRNVLVDLDAPPEWFARQQPDCLTADEARALAGTTGSVRLLTYAPSAGYEQNPISVYYCWDAPLSPGAPTEEGVPPVRALAEVTNTPWGERVRFAFGLHADAVPKPLHVSPLWHMGTLWRINVPPPGDAIHVSFIAEQPGTPGGEDAAPGGPHRHHHHGPQAPHVPPPAGPLFRATLTLRRVAPPYGPPEAWAWLMPHKVAFWIYWQAARLMAKGVTFYPHPKYATRNAYRAHAAGVERTMKRVATGARPGGCPAFSYREAQSPPWTLQ